MGVSEVYVERPPGGGDEVAAGADLSPIQGYLQRLHEALRQETSGAVADYIPELGRAAPDDFGIAIATVDGTLYHVGDAERLYTIQSMSKPFSYGYALREYGRERVLRQVGVEPTGEAFNSIILDDRHNRPFNPMVNAGAIAVAELMRGETDDEREANMLALFSDMAGRRVEIDPDVYGSELETGHRNRAIAYMMLNTGMIDSDPEAVLRLYFKQCSVKVSCIDMAIMAATLANRGVNPRTGKTVFEAEQVQDVLTLMSTCGMYNYAGEWAYDVGLPAKSGVSGGIIAAIPGQLGVAVYAPPLDQHGNSIRGVMACKEISRDFSLHAYADRVNVGTVIRREYRGNEVSSKLVRSARAQDTLHREGGRIAVIEVQGALFFGSAEMLIRRLMELVEEVDYIAVDFRRASHADPAALQLIRGTVDAFAKLDCTLAFTGLNMGHGTLMQLRDMLAGGVEASGLKMFDDVDDALQTFEDILLEENPDFSDNTKFSLREMDLLRGMGDAEYAALERCVAPFYFDAGQQVIREGDEANLLFIVARGSVSVSVALDGERRKRVASVGPGFSFGEMALLDGGRRSADVFADENLICYGFSVKTINELSEQFPNIKATILANLVRSLSDRLRLANAEIRALE